MSDTNYKAGYNVGAAIACAASNASVGDAVKAAAFNSTIIADHQMQGDLCKIACAIFDMAGMSDSKEFALYRNAAARNAEGHTMSKVAAEAFLFPVAEAIYAENNKVHEEILEKSAGVGLGEVLSKLVRYGGRSAALTSDVYNKILALSIGLGGSGGALAWYLNRDANQDEADTESKLEQAKHYKRLANDIKSRMAANEASVQEAAKAQEDNAYIV